MYSKKQLRAITRQHLHGEGREWLMDRFEDALTVVEELEKRCDAAEKLLDLEALFKLGWVSRCPWCGAFVVEKGVHWDDCTWKKYEASQKTPKVTP